MTGRAIAPAVHRVVRAIWLAVMLAGVPATALAQSASSAAIQGQVKDESGGVLPGVTVTLTSPALQVPQLTATTEADGTYAFRDLSPGVYRASYELSGFTTFVRQNVELPVGFVAKIDVSLKIGGLQETVSVSGEAPVIDVKTTAATSNFSNQVIETIPRGRSLWDVLSMAPGVTVAAAPDVGDSTMSHRSDMSNYGGTGLPKLAIDGINVQTGGDRSGAYYMDFANYDEVQVKSAGNDAEMATSGVNFLATIKSGGNDFHGTYHGAYQGPSLQSNNIDAALRAQGIQTKAPLRYYYDASGDLGGRIIRDRLWFYGSMSRQQLVTQKIGFAKAPGPDGVYLTGDDVPGDTSTRLDNETLKVSFQPARKYRLIGLYQRGIKDLPDGGQDGSRFRPLEATTNYHFVSTVTKGELQGTPTNKLLVNVVGGFYGYVADYKAQKSADVAGNPSREDLATGLYTGPTSQATRRPNWRTQTEGSLTYFLDQTRTGKHDLKAGYSLYFEGTGTGYLNKASGNYLLLFDTINGVPNTPYEINTYNYPVDPTNLMHSAGLYVKDIWTLGNDVTLDLGLRWDRYHAFVPKQDKPQGLFGGSGTFSSVDVLTWQHVVPRAAIAWDVRGNGKTVVKATYGEFNTPMTNGFASPYNRAASQTTTYLWHDLNGNRDYDAGEVDLDTNGNDFVSTSNAANNINNRDLEQPRAREVTAGLEREVAPNVAVHALYVYQRESDNFQTVNVLRPYDAYNIPITRTDPGPDGKLGTGDDGGTVTIYDYDAAYRGSAFVGNERFNVSSADHYNSIEFGLTKRTSRRWGLMASIDAIKAHRWITEQPALTPNDLPFPLDETWTWNGKLSGSLRLPYDIQFSALWQTQRGNAGQRTNAFRAKDASGPALKQLTSVTLALEPYGSERTPEINTVNLRWLKEFTAGSTRRWGLELGIYNLLNSNVPSPSGTGAAGVNYKSGPTYGYITSILDPRIVRFGARFSF
ncbi:MAG TPA: carboxypeptidase regulatory-like domain-containing protein [Vicinamibacterales bacterium]|nr:carboxypeptidase regulatory-like domain-containing protein [Vicinamibacterales bacterium]